jgi:hypothetical protein
MQKAGTTWLYAQLARHPQVAFPGGKEVHFWDRVGAGHADRWLAMLEPPARTDAAGRPIRSGEITPAYASLSQETIRALRESCPSVRLFISFRNPLERAWSAALMALVRAQMLADEVSDQWFIDHFRSAASRRAGDYAATMERWLTVFPAEQVLPLVRDDIEVRPRDVLRTLADHLGIDAADFAAVSAADLATRVVPVLTADVAFKTQQDLPPRPTLVPVLKEMYAPEVARMSRLLGRDLQRWADDFGSGPAARPLPRHEVRIGSTGHIAVNQWLVEGAASAAPLAAPRNIGVVPESAGGETPT